MENRTIIFVLVVYEYVMDQLTGETVLMMNGPLHDNDDEDDDDDDDDNDDDRLNTFRAFLDVNLHESRGKTIII